MSMYVYAWMASSLHHCLHSMNNTLDNPHNKHILQVLTYNTCIFIVLTMAKTALCKCICFGAIASLQQARSRLYFMQGLVWSYMLNGNINMNPLATCDLVYNFTCTWSVTGSHIPWNNASQNFNKT